MLTKITARHGDVPDELRERAVAIGPADMRAGLW